MLSSLNRIPLALEAPQNEVHARSAQRAPIPESYRIVAGFLASSKRDIEWRQTCVMQSLTF